MGLQALIVLLTLPTAYAAHGASVVPEKITFQGEYQWRADPRNPGALKATFSPDGQGNYRVAFYFRFDGRKHVYRGTATGSLTEGPLKGKVKNERGNRTFTFNGTVGNGRFWGDHGEINRYGKIYGTGTFTLTR